MPDIVDAQTRSRMMSGIRSRDTKPELRVRRWLHARGLRYRLHDRRLPGTPDVVLAKYNTVIFVHGCFWHQHPGCRFAYRPSTRADFWGAKLSRNVSRDSSQQSALVAAGWRVLTIWECEVGDDRALEALVVEVKSALPTQPLLFSARSQRERT
jgi:DNA mismatch endonuclease (patch repair protein)